MLPVDVPTVEEFVSITPVQAAIAAIRPSVLFLLAASFVLLLGGMQADADVGRFQFVYGAVDVVGSDGVARRARRGTSIDQGETVRTSSRASAQLRMVDGAALAIRPSTALRIDDYSFKRSEKPDRSFMSLLSGTFRSITGLIGRSDRSSYRVSTPTATIGIRGSDAEIGHDPTTGVSAVRTFAGGHSMTADDGQGQPVTVETNPGQIAVASPGEGPSFSATFPFAVNALPGIRSRQGPAGQAGGTARQGGQSPQGGVGGGANTLGDASARATAGGGPDALGVGGPAPIGGAAGFVSSAVPPCQSSQVCQQPEAFLAAQSAQQPVSQPNFAPVGTGLVSALAFDNSGPTGVRTGAVRITSGTGPTSIVLGQGGEPVAFTGPTPPGLVFTAETPPPPQQTPFQIFNGAQVVSTGSWGFWSAPFSVSEGATSLLPRSVLHFALADRFTTVGEITALSGVAFDFDTAGIIGGTATNELGEPPLLTPTGFRTNVTGTFGSGATLGNVNVFVGVEFPAGEWSLSGAGTVASFIGNGIPLGGGCSQCGRSPSGSASGVFLGPQASGVIMSFSATDDVVFITGTSVIKRVQPVP